MTPSAKPPAAKASNPIDFPLEGWDHQRLVVGNARQAAHFYSTAFGMRWVAYRGPETGSRRLATRTFLEDGDEVLLRATGPGGLRLGECRGEVLSARPRAGTR